MTFQNNQKMRYPCIGNPHCLKTFEYGHALRAHIASCVEAQKKLKQKSKVENMENEVANEYNGIVGLHCNKYFPVFHHVDASMKYQFKDRFKLSGRTDRPESFNNKEILRPLRMAVKSNVHSSLQVHQAMSYQQ